MTLDHRSTATTAGVNIDMDCANINIISYNMHGYNQGSHTVRDLIVDNNRIKPDVFLLQEHWLTPCNLTKFEENFPNYMCFGSSAMNDRVASGILRGRPFGGLMTLVNKSLVGCTEVVCASERYVITIVGNLLIINVYLPCVGVNDRHLICEEILNNILFYMKKYCDRITIVGGDLNTDLDQSNSVSKLLNEFSLFNNLYRCDTLLPNVLKRNTYINEALNHQSMIDFFLSTDKDIVSSFDVIDCNINLSDHEPITINCKCNIALLSPADTKEREIDCMQVKQLRWDHADLISYCNRTGLYLQSVYDELSLLETCSVQKCDYANNLDAIYNRLVDILRDAAEAIIPSFKKNFFKFWWDQEMDELKQKSIDSCKLWKAAGKPRSGQIFSKYRKDKSAYRNGLRRHQREETSVYTNSLHDALVAKQGPTFWKCWKSKFESKRSAINHIDGTIDAATITEHFAEHFRKTCSHLTLDGADRLKSQYNNMRQNYCGMPNTNRHLFDAELVENIIANLKRGKAAGLDGLTAEHLQNCHALLPCILAKLFNLMMSSGYVPASFGQTYTVPIPKGNNVIKNLTVNDFRGITISCVLSKVFEHCIYDRYQSFFDSSDNQFGFKRNSGCSNAIYTLRCAVEHYNLSGSTVNLCAIDLSKAFDKMNHHGLFVKLMDSRIPINLLVILENWFAIGCTCVKWGSYYSSFYHLSCGIRQGGVLSPHMFAKYIDSIVDKVKKERSLGCYIDWQCVTILLYADDIIIIAPTVMSLQKLLSVVEQELHYLDMAINAMKSHCMRIGPHCDANCASIVTRDGLEIAWTDCICYLGVYLVAGKNFKCSFSNGKKSFYRAFNGIFGKIGRIASEEVIIQLVKSKCIPAMLYGLDVCPINKSQINSLQFAITGTFMKLFRVKNKEEAQEYMCYFGFPTVEAQIHKRKCKFLSNICYNNNSLCKLFSQKAQAEYEEIRRHLLDA